MGLSIWSRLSGWRPIVTTPPLKATSRKTSSENLSDNFAVLSCQRQVSCARSCVTGTRFCVIGAPKKYFSVFSREILVQGGDFKRTKTYFLGAPMTQNLVP